MEVLKLLQSKNKCLERLLSNSCEFLSFLERGDFTQLSAMEKNWEKTLKTFSLYDRKISETLATMPEDLKTYELIESVRQQVSEKEKLIHSILEIDNKIILLLEKEKSRLHKELQDSERSKTLVKKFKSQWISEAGDKLDGTI